MKYPVTEDCDPDAAGWWTPRYQNCRSLALYLGDPDPWYTEGLAVRVTQWLNNCLSLDWCYESCLVTIIRETGPGFRVGHFLTFFNIVFLSDLYLHTPLLFAYDTERSESEWRFGNYTVGICVFLWAIDFGLAAYAYFLVRYHMVPSMPGTMGECTPFFRQRPEMLRENREKLPVSVYNQILRTFHACFFFLYFVVCTLGIHTLCAHMYTTRNPYYAALLLMITFMALMSALDDLSQIGSPWGIQEVSKTASVLLSVRGLYLIPLTVVWSAAAVAASFPPFTCVEC